MAYHLVKKVFIDDHFMLLCNKEHFQEIWYNCTFNIYIQHVHHFVRDICLCMVSKIISFLQWHVFRNIKWKISLWRGYPAFKYWFLKYNIINNGPFFKFCLLQLWKEIRRKGIYVSFLCNQNASLNYSLYWIQQYSLTLFLSCFVYSFFLIWYTDIEVVI